jgi:hypothetical protein
MGFMNADWQREVMLLLYKWRYPGNRMEQGTLADATKVEVWYDYA